MRISRWMVLVPALAAGILAGISGGSARAADSPPLPVPKVKLGDRAPDFKLKDQAMNDVTLGDFRGKKKVVLAFYVFAFTGG